MSQSELPQPLPPGWVVSHNKSYYFWVDPRGDDSPDVYISRLNNRWEIEYWIKNREGWIQVSVPLTPEPPFELAEALYYAAQ